MENAVAGSQKQRDRSGIEDGRVEIDGIGTLHKEIDHCGLPHCEPFYKKLSEFVDLGQVLCRVDRIEKNMLILKEGSTYFYYNLTIVAFFRLAYSSGFSC